jgi:hypothetical protein
VPTSRAACLRIKATSRSILWGKHRTCLKIASPLTVRRSRPIIKLLSLAADASYSLFNPTPDDKLRSFSTDRPTKSNSPYTVDAGRFQYETDIFNYTYVNFAGQKTRIYQTLDPVWKVGLTNSVDFELQFNGYQNVTTRDTTTGAVLSRGYGFGDVYARTKINLFGNDGGTAALALIPYVKAPSRTDVLSNGLVEGGIIAPLRLAVTDDYGVIFMTQVDALKNANSSNRHANFVNLVNFSGPVPGIENLTAYIELYSAVGTDRNIPAIYTFDAALSYNITPTLQIDVGANIGLNKAAPNLQLYTGIAQRF